MGLTANNLDAVRESVLQYFLSTDRQCSTSPAISIMIRAHVTEFHLGDLD